jgi:hypothetical protein
MNFRAAISSDFDEVLKTSTQPGRKDPPAVTDCWYALEHEGRVLAIGGVKLFNEWSALAWLDLSSYAMQHKIQVYRVIKEWLDELMEKLALIRVVAFVDPSFEAGINTVTHLGFTIECALEDHLGPGKPGLQFVKFRRS